MARLFGALCAGLPDARIISMGISPAHGIRGWIRRYIEAYVEAQRVESAKFGASFLDFRPLWAARGDAWLAKATPDGAHPKPEAAISVMVPLPVEELSGGRCGTHRPDSFGWHRDRSSHGLPMA